MPRFANLGIPNERALCGIRTVTLAQSHGLTFYDASYLAVAEEEKVVLVTADGKFYRRLPAGLPVELLE